MKQVNWLEIKLCKHAMVEWLVTLSQILEMRVPIPLNPLLPIVPYGTFSQKFYFNLRRDHQKNSYDRRDYESVDEKSLSWARCPEKRQKKNQMVKAQTFSSNKTTITHSNL